jgi:hypothetical protein
MSIATFSLPGVSPETGKLVTEEVSGRGTLLLVFFDGTSSEF